MEESLGDELINPCDLIGQLVGKMVSLLQHFLASFLRKEDEKRPNASKSPQILSELPIGGLEVAPSRLLEGFCPKMTDGEDICRIVFTFHE